MTEEAQSAKEIREIKHAVRVRDAFRCTECGMTNDEHAERYAAILHVHRIVRGSLYSLAGCKTLCEGCHIEEHRSDPPLGGRPSNPDPRTIRVAVMVSPDERAALKADAESWGMNVSNYIRLCLALSRRESVA